MTDSKEKLGTGIKFNYISLIILLTAGSILYYIKSVFTMPSEIVTLFITVILLFFGIIIQANSDSKQEKRFSDIEEEIRKLKEKK